MTPFPDAYVIPNDIKALVRGEKGGANFMEMLMKLAPKKARSNPKTYHESFSTKLFLEEVACYSKDYDRINNFFGSIRIEHFYYKQFRFKITVSIQFNSIILIYFKNFIFFNIFNSFNIYIIFRKKLHS